MALLLHQVFLNFAKAQNDGLLEDSDDEESASQPQLPATEGPPGYTNHAYDTMEFAPAPKHIHHMAALENQNAMQVARPEAVHVIDHANETLDNGAVKNNPPANGGIKDQVSPAGPTQAGHTSSLDAGVSVVTVDPNLHTNNLPSTVTQGTVTTHTDNNVTNVTIF